MYKRQGQNLFTNDDIVAAITESDLKEHLFEKIKETVFDNDSSLKDYITEYSLCLLYTSSKSLAGNMSLSILNGTVMIREVKETNISIFRSGKLRWTNIQDFSHVWINSCLLYTSRKIKGRYEN